MRFLRHILALGRFLTAAPKPVAGLDPQRLEHPAGALLLLAAAWGLALVGLWDVTFRLTSPRLLNWVDPSLVCGFAVVLGPYRQSGLALTATFARRQRWLCWLGLLALGLGLWTILNAAVRSDPNWPPQLPRGWEWLWPRALYRVLLLAPLWGAWGMLTIGQFHRPGARTDPATRQFVLSTGPVAVAAALVVPLAGTLVYLNFLYPLHFVPAAAALAAALGGGTAIVRAFGGLCREALLATNLLTQLGFLLGYLAVR